MKTKFASIAVLLMLTVAGWCHGQVIFRENFEHGTDTFTGLKKDTVNPGEGKICALLQPVNPNKNEVADATGKVLIPVKPDTWYRISFLFRNTIYAGYIK